MADETPPPPAAPGQPERRRPAPTIDLKSSEFASAPVADTAPLKPPDPSAPAGGLSWLLVGAVLAAVILTLGVAWMVASGASKESAAADVRIARLEREVADLAPSADDLASRLKRLEAEVAKVPPAPRPLADPALSNRIAALEAQLKSLSETVGALGQRSDSAAAANAAALSDINQRLAHQDPPGAPSGEASTAGAAANAAAANAAIIAALADRLDALEGGAKTTETALAAEVAKRDAESQDDHAVRTAVTAAVLTSVVERGRPFAAELKAAQSQAPDPGALAPLEAFAATGVPNPNALLRELTSLQPALLQAAGAGAPEGGFLEKLQANAERLVRIRPIEEIPGDDPAAVIARIEVKAVRGDLPGALAELGKLPAPVRAPAQPWIAKAQARADALSASRAFAADALTALARPSR
jgi:hypothetical protein